MKYFVIGSGSIGQRHFNNLQQLGANVKLFSWRKINTKPNFAEIYEAGSKAAVVIATSTDIRVPLILDCAKEGASLYIEKPIAFKHADLKEIFALPREVQSRSVAGFMMRYHPIVQALLDFQNEGFFRGNFEVGHDVRQWRQDWNFGASYASKSSGGGVLLDLCHEIDIAHLLLKEPRIESVKSLADKRFPSVDLATQVTLLKKSGGVFNVNLDYMASSLIRRGTLVGAKTQVEYDLVKGSLRITRKGSMKDINFEIDRNQMFLNFMIDFMKLSEGEPTQNPYIPRLNGVEKICFEIAKAWERREFIGHLRSELKA